MYWVLTAPDPDEDGEPTAEQAAKYGSGDVDELPEHLVTNCGKYFARHGTTIIFGLVPQVEGRTIMDATYVVEIRRLKIVLDDSLARPFARNIVLETGERGAEVKLSSKDFQQARCLSVDADTRT